MHIQFPTKPDGGKSNSGFESFFLPRVFFSAKSQIPKSEFFFVVFPEKRIEKYPLKASAKVLLDVFNLFWEFRGK